MAKISEEIVAKIHGSDPVAVTLAGGYLVNRDGSRVLFPPGRIVKERLNDSGRCTRLECSYGDGSAIVFTWHPAHGAKYRA